VGTLSVNTYGGISLIIGPVITLVFFFLQPGNVIIDQADPADAGATINAMVSNAAMSKLTNVIIPIGLLVFLYGIFVVQGNVRSNGNGDALSRYGVQFILIGVVGWVIATGLSLAISGSGLPADQATAAFGSLYSATLGIGTVAGILAGLGFLALALALSTRDDYNKIAALVAAVAAVVVVVVAIIGGIDSSQLQTMSQITGVCYLVHSAWMILLGLDLLKKG
jgi:hypothetical protein